MRVREIGVRLAAVTALVTLSCSEADTSATDGGGCESGDCIFASQMCPPGESVTGVDGDGAIICEPTTGLRNQTCSGRLVVGGIRADGSVVCVEPFADASCEAGQVLTGITATGEPTCVPVGDLVRSYINTNCYIYLGWRDSCDGCVNVPTKVGRTRGDAAGCLVSGADGSCATFDLFGQMVEMTSISTDGDVNDDDKFWVGLKCE